MKQVGKFLLLSRMVIIQHTCFANQTQSFAIHIQPFALQT